MKASTAWPQLLRISMISVGEWLRIGNRIEILLVVLAVLCFMGLGVAAVVCCGSDLVILAILFSAIAAFTLTIWVPAFLIVRWGRKGTLRSSRPEGDSQHAGWSRYRLYVLVTLVTLISVFYQYYRIDIRFWPLGHSLTTIFLSNFAILGIVIAAVEFLQRRRH